MLIQPGKNFVCMNFFNCFPLVSFFVFIAIIIRKVIILKRREVSVSGVTKNNIVTKFFLYPVFIIIFALFIAELVSLAINTSNLLLPKLVTKNLISSVYLKVAGVLLICIALFLLSLTLYHFSESLRFGTNSENLGELITTGVFSISRNPFFVSILLYFVGNAFINPSLFFIVFACLASVGIHFFILKEEKFLRKNYGEKYKSYAKKVRRYF